MAEVHDKIDITPNISREYGRAWVIDLDKLRATLNFGHDATVAGWVVEAKWAHPFWHSYAIHVVSLADVPGLPAPKIYLSGATHEIWVEALHAQAERVSIVRGSESYIGSALHPMNFAAQFVAESDDAARARVERAVTLVCDGELSPDTDFLSQWVTLFGDSMVRKDAAVCA